MDFIHRLAEEKYDIYNFKDKMPIDGNTGYGLPQWEKKPLDVLVKTHNYNLTTWGIRLGLQTNGKRIMSLDFDIYDKNTDADDKTLLDKFQHYKANALRLDGMYSSSTSGNFNVLIDYTNNQTIQNLVKENENTKKFKVYGGLEVFLNQTNQVIPPSKTTNKKSQVADTPRKFLDANKPFYVCDENDDFTVTFVTSLFEEYKKEKPTKSKKIISSATSPISVPMKDDKYIDLLFNVIKNEKEDSTWDRWFQIAGILKNNGYSYETFESYSNILCPNDPETERLWNSIKDNNNMSIYGLQNIAKKCNPSAYKNWIIQHNQYLNLSILEKGARNIAEFVKDALSSDLIYCNDTWYEFNKKTSLWNVTKDASVTITTTVQRKIDEASECLYIQINNCCDTESDDYKNLQKQKKKYNTFYEKVSQSSFHSQITKYLKSYLKDDTFSEKLDDNPYEMAFKNGIFDMKNMTFQKGIQQNNYLTKTIPSDFEYPSDDEVAYVIEVLKKICNYNDRHLEFYLAMLGYAMTGDSQREQFFWYLLGQTASNGKSILFEILEVLMPNYIRKSTSDFMDKGVDNKKEIACWSGLRLVWINELSRKKKDEDFMKSLADGTSISYKPNYAVKSAIMNITFKLICVSNNSLEIKADEGIKRRFQQMKIKSQFKPEFTDNYEKLEFKADKDLNTKITTTYKNALFYILLEYGNKYYKNKCLPEYPVEWKTERDDAFADNDYFKEWFETNCDVGAECMVSKKFISEYVSQDKSITGLNFRDEIERLKLAIDYNSQEQKYDRSSGKVIRVKGFYKGFKIKNYDMFGNYFEEEDMDDEPSEETKTQEMTDANGKKILLAKKVRQTYGGMEIK
jgi:hypothetical protein